MKITDEAVEAAWSAMPQESYVDNIAQVRAMLEAALPFLIKGSGVRSIEEVVVTAIQACGGVYADKSDYSRDDWGNEAETIDEWYREAVRAALGGTK